MFVSISFVLKVFIYPLPIKISEAVIYTLRHEYISLSTYRHTKIYYRYKIRPLIFWLTITAILNSQNLNYHLLKSIYALAKIIFATIKDFVTSFFFSASF